MIMDPVGYVATSIGKARESAEKIAAEKVASEKEQRELAKDILKTVSEQVRSGPTGTTTDPKPAVTPMANTEPDARTTALEPKDDNGYRTWSDASGAHTIKARFGGSINETVTLIKEDGSKVSLPLDKLSEQDRQWLADRRNKKR